ncbi:hypothetical protein L3V82_10830 [Thiotrichales bacterium 19S3-7]|nr:hypothetical protein [Thiotrichales bacterium 19S3-7]MCF6802652.1 hypothetical protein [Thiotrichales bacterium 19S3-11]
MPYVNDDIRITAKQILRPLSKPSGDTEEKVNCSLVTIAAILGKTVNQLKKDMYNRYKNTENSIPIQTSSDQYLGVITGYSGLSIGHEEQIKGMQKYFGDLSQHSILIPEITDIKHFKISKHDLSHTQDIIQTQCSDIKNGSSFAVFIQGIDGAHWVYGQKDKLGKISFVDFQRDMDGDKPEVLSEPMFPVFDEGKPISLSGSNVAISMVVFNEMAPSWIQEKIQNQFKENHIGAPRQSHEDLPKWMSMELKSLGYGSDSDEYKIDSAADGDEIEIKATTMPIGATRSTTTSKPSNPKMPLLSSEKQSEQKSDECCCVIL